jgi:hypothetical protein
MQRWFVVTIAMTMLAGCYAAPRGGVTPYPPGPVDTLNILLRNDYSRLCPEHFDYCRAGKNSICCPTGGCCDDGVAPYCCDTRGYAGREYDQRDYDQSAEQYEQPHAYAPGAGGPCGARGTTCSRGGVTICCSDNEGCCSDDQGLYCCSTRRGGGY